MTEYPKNVSFAAHEMLKEFSESTLSLEPESLRQKGERAASMLRLFVGDTLPEPAYDGAMLLPLARHIQQGQTEQASDASWAIMDYLTSPEEGRQVSDEAIEYLLDVWGDFKIIDQAVWDYEARIKERETAMGSQTLRLIHAEDDTPIAAEEWTSVRIGVNIPKIREVTHEVNVESVVIGAASLLDDIIHNKEDKRQQMHNILVAETFYCPALDALGLTAMEMAMRSEVNKVRLVNAGRSDLNQKATELLKPVKAIGQDRVLEELFGVPLSNEKTSFHLDDETPYGTTVHFRDSLLNVDLEGLGPLDIRTVTRTKMAESVAMKMMENPHYENTTPSDLVGITAIPQGETQLAALFNHVIKRMTSRADTFTLAAAASKKQPMYVQGSAEYVASLKEKFDPAILDQVEFKICDGSKSAFQVAKVTFTATIDGIEIPVEFQFQTEADRERARIGNFEVSHTAQKSRNTHPDLPGNNPGEPNHLREINERRHTWLTLDKKVIVVGHNGAEFAGDVDRAAM